MNKKQLDKERSKISLRVFMSNKVILFIGMIAIFLGIFLEDLILFVGGLWIVGIIIIWVMLNDIEWQREMKLKWT